MLIHSPIHTVPLSAAAYSVYSQLTSFSWSSPDPQPGDAPGSMENAHLLSNRTRGHLCIITYLCIIVLLYYLDKTERMDAHNVLNDVLVLQKLRNKICNDNKLLKV